MNDLSIFTDDEIQQLSSLLVKAGFYVSYADDEDGEQDDEKEYKAMTACIRAVAKKYDGPGIVDDIARTTLLSESDWMNWDAGVFQTPQAAKAAITLVREKCGEVDAKNYRTAVMQIAASVARAYGEFSSFDEEIPDDENFFSSLANKVVGAFSSMSQEDKNHPSNISAAEDSALSRLSAALKVEV